jgi:hypothetical protein
LPLETLSETKFVKASISLLLRIATVYLSSFSIYNCKVSGLYSFIDGEKVFTVYDWKSTSLWGDDLPSPLAFWNSQRREELSIGGNCEDAAEFRSWLLQKYQDSIKTMVPG